MSLLAALCLAAAVLSGWRRPPGVRIAGRLAPARASVRRREPRVGPRVLRARRAECAELVGAVAAELVAGAAWDTALRRGSAVSATLAPRLAPAAAPLVALRRLAATPGREGLAALVAVAELSSQTGAAAAGLVSRVGDLLRADDRARRAVDVELASALATARLLAGLPLVGLAMGAAVGAHPAAVLLGTPAGWVCLLLAAGLELAGLAWCRRIRRGASP